MRYRRGAGILMYHNFPAGKRTEYEQQFDFLSRNYRFVSMGELGEAVRQGRRLPPRSLALTVDDGYRDFYTVAFPILRQHRIPVTVYLYTDFLDRKAWPWWDKVQFVCQNTALAAAAVPLPAGGRLTLRFETGEQRSSAALALGAAMKDLPGESRMQVLCELQGILQVSVPLEPPFEVAPLTWDEVRFLQRNGVEFGAHTMTHPLLSQLRSADEIAVEVQGSARRIEEETGKLPVHFCYPNGRYQDIGLRARTVVEKCGFQTAVTTEPGFNQHSPDPLLLERIGIDPWFPESVFRERVAGITVLKKELRRWKAGVKNQESSQAVA